MTVNRAHAHNRAAPYWAAALVIFCVTGLASTAIDRPGIWNSYTLDAVGPAWNYILFRGLFTSWTENRWTKFFTPVRVFLLAVGFCFGVEGAQFLKLYPSTYDPVDLLAYVSLLTPCFIVDQILLSRYQELNRRGKTADTV